MIFESLEQKRPMGETSPSLAFGFASPLPETRNTKANCMRGGFNPLLSFTSCRQVLPQKVRHVKFSWAEAPRPFTTGGLLQPVAATVVS